MWSKVSIRPLIFEEFLVMYLYLKTINYQFAHLNFQVVCNCSKYKSEVILEHLLVCKVISTWIVSDHTYEKFKCNQQFLLDIVRGVLLDCSSRKILNGCQSNTWKPNLNLFCRVSIFFVQEGILLGESSSHQESFEIKIFALNICIRTVICLKFILGHLP